MTFLRKTSNLLLNKPIIIFIVFMFLIKPGIVNLNGTINMLYNVASVTLIAVIILLYILRGKISKLQIALIIFISCLGISTCFGTQDFSTFAKTYSMILGISLYTEMVINTNLEKFLKALTALVSVYIILNFLTILFVPHGFIGDGTLHDFYFLGYDNASVHTIVLGLVVVMISSHYFHKKLTPFALIMIGIGALSYYLVWAASCLVSVSLLVFYVIFVYKRQFFKKFLNFKVLFGFAILFFLVIVILRWQDIFSWFIVDVLHRDLTLTGRTYIWDRCMTQIGNHPILGLGVQAEAVRLSTLGIYHAHSGLLNVLLEGGIIGFVAFLNIFRVATKSLTTKENKVNEFSAICTFALFIYFISTLVDVIVDSYLFYILLNICYFIPLIKEKFEEREKLNENTDS